MPGERQKAYKATKFGEGQTTDGQLVRFRVEVDSIGDTEAVPRAQEALALFSHLDTVQSLPTTRNIQHGGYGQYTRYDIDQLEYWGGGGFAEALHIKDAPEGYHPIVTYSMFPREGGRDAYFVEWKDEASALAGLRRFANQATFEQIPEDEDESKGFIRAVNLGSLQPWFYAVGDAQLMGDYVFPEHLAGHPVFTPGRQFIVPTKEFWLDKVAHTTVKTSMGAYTREVPTKKYNGWGYDDGDPQIHTTVQWNDGSLTEITPETPQQLLPIPIETQPWVAEAYKGVQAALAGKALGFTVNFADGSKFVGRFVEAPEKKSDPEGDYFVRVSMVDGSTREGRVTFSPTAELPSVQSYVHHHYSKNGHEYTHISVDRMETKRNGRKAAGIFFAPPTNASPYEVNSTQNSEEE